MKTIRKTFRCPQCGSKFERTVLETALTAACPNCRPVVSFLEWLGLTPGQAVVLTLIGAAIVYAANNDS